jgi:DNA-directed RNA polymerase subunit beta'
MPKILDYDSFCENLPEVSSLKIMNKKYFHPNGLFSEQIFGPVKNYTCQCGTYWGVSKKGSTCNLCKVDIENSDVRRKRFAKIILPIEVVNPIFYDLVCDLGGKPLKSGLYDLMKSEKSVLVQDGEDYYVTVQPELIKSYDHKWEKAEAIKKWVEVFAKNGIDDGQDEWKMVLDKIDNLMINKIIVLPPDLRPSSPTKGSKNKQLMDKINRYYVQVLNKKEVMQQTTINIHHDKELYYTYFKQLQKDVNELYERILQKMAKKEGLIRGNILGKRIDFSGRAVITPDPTLKLDQCALPYFMVLEIFKLPIAKKLIEIGKFKLLNKAIDFVEKCMEIRSPVLEHVCRNVIQGEVCILNRQPSLHKLGMLGFNIKLSMGNSIKIHPLVCPPFNADFDGDQMAVYIPVSKEAKQEVIEKIFVTNNLSSPANESLTTTPSQDVILGIYALTSDKFKDLESIVEYKGKEITEGQKIFNDALPDNFPVISIPVKKKGLMKILNAIKDNYPKEIVAATLDEIKRIGFKYSTLFGSTMSLDDCYYPNAEDERNEIYNQGGIRDQLIALNDDSIVEKMRKTFKYAFMIDSGARGSWDQVKQLIFSRAYISNFDGEILPLPIKHNLIDGLTPEEFFYSTYGSRKGLLDVALNTGTSGYLSRKLIFTCANLQIDNDLENCGTTDCLAVDVKNERKSLMLINRWQRMKGGTLRLITRENYKENIGKTIYVRSPIYCKSKNICHKCYGELKNVLNSRFIGILAAQTLGERSTQLVLRTFHTSGSAIIKGESNQDDSDMKQQDIIGDLATVSSMLHRFDHNDPVKLVDSLFDVYDKDIYHVHYECVVSQLMWHNYRKWRLLDNRDEVEPKFYSIQAVPNQESWVLAMAFSNPKRSILQGIMYEGRYSGVLDKILKGEKIN